jgi:TrmH family RNA methyltransferase
MLVEKITSRQNPLVKRFRLARSGDERGLLFIEGVRLVEEALRSGLRFESIAFTQSVRVNERGAKLLDALVEVPCRGANVSPQVMQALADTETPQGIAALVNRPFHQLDGLFDNNIDVLVVADQLQDPGNLGTIIRTAEAAGAGALITTRNTVDAFSQKALRASMGSAFRLPVVTGVRTKELLPLFETHKLRLVATRPPPAAPERSSQSKKPLTSYSEFSLSEPFVLVLGDEAEGVSPELLAAARESVFIPMASTVDSLNVASAAAIILFEAARQRGFKFKAGN